MANKQKEPSFEERMQRLQEIVSLLENVNNPLEDSVHLYKEGLEHSVACRAMLASARHEIEVLSNGVTAPFHTDADDIEQDAGERDE